MAASTSCASKSPFPLKDTTCSLIQYPATKAKYQEVAANKQLFMSTLEQLHSSMGTKFMNLMAKQDMSELGFVKESDKEASEEKITERIENQEGSQGGSWNQGTTYTQSLNNKSKKKKNSTEFCAVQLHKTLHGHADPCNSH